MPADNAPSTDAASERESMEVDAVIVGAGPAGLSAACRLMQLAREKSRELSVVVAGKRLGSRRAHFVGRGV